MPSEPSEDTIRLQRAAVAALERRQREIADAVHDTLCQTLGAVGMMVEVLAARLKGGNAVELAQLDSLAEKLDRGVDEARRIFTQLQPVMPGKDGLMTALARLAAETTARGITCAFECEDAIFIDNPEAALSLYRVAEEAVSNAVGLPESARIGVSLVQRNEVIVITVSHNGCPPSVAADFELMRFRALTAGGQFSSEAKSNGVTTVTFTLPRTVALAPTG